MIKEKAPELVGQRNTQVLNCIKPHGSHRYEKNDTCPIDGEKFIGLTWRSFSSQHEYLDLEPISYARSPLPKIICPTHGLIIEEDSYDKQRLEQMNKVIASEEYQSYYKAGHSSYFLYAKTLEMLNEKADDQWWLYLKATWEADNCGNKDRYKEYNLIVIEEARKRLALFNPTQMEYWNVALIVPNAYRRIGDFNLARKWFEKAGTPATSNEKANDSFRLALRLLDKAITEENEKPGSDQAK